MNKYDQALQLFCADDAIRMNLMNPWCDESEQRVVASNSHVLMAIFDSLSEVRDVLTPAISYRNVLDIAMPGWATSVPDRVVNIAQIDSALACVKMVEDWQYMDCTCNSGCNKCDGELAIPDKSKPRHMRPVEGQIIEFGDIFIAESVLRKIADAMRILGISSITVRVWNIASIQKNQPHKCGCVLFKFDGGIMVAMGWDNNDSMIEPVAMITPARVAGEIIESLAV